MYRVHIFLNKVKLFCVFVILLKKFGNVNGLPRTLKIGAIFSESQRLSATELAFKYAIFNINRDKGLLPETSLHYDIQYTNELDSFHACKKGIFAFVLNLKTFPINLNFNL